MNRQYLPLITKACYLSSLFAWFFLVACSPNKTDDQTKQVKRPAPLRAQDFTTARKYSTFGAENFAAWQSQVPYVKHIGISSFMDGHVDSVLFYASASPKKKPLLVVLHSWSTSYLQQASIPFTRGLTRWQYPVNSAAQLRKYRFFALGLNLRLN
jgi:hypothetical protein